LREQGIKIDDTTISDFLVLFINELNVLGTSQGLHAL